MSFITRERTIKKWLLNKCIADRTTIRVICKDVEEKSAQAKDATVGSMEQTTNDGKGRQKTGTKGQTKKLKDSVGKAELKGQTTVVVGREWNKEEKQTSCPRGKVEGEKARPMEETKMEAKGREIAETKKGGGEEQGRGREENEQSNLEDISKYKAEPEQNSLNAIEAAKERYERAKEAASEAAKERNKQANNKATMEKTLNKLGFTTNPSYSVKCSN